MKEEEASRIVEAKKKLGTIVRAYKNRWHDDNRYFIMLADGTTIERYCCRDYEVGDKVWYYPVTIDHAHFIGVSLSPQSSIEIAEVKGLQKCAYCGNPLQPKPEEKCATCGAIAR